MQGLYYAALTLNPRCSAMHSISFCFCSLLFLMILPLLYELFVFILFSGASKLKTRVSGCPMKSEECTFRFYFNLNILILLILCNVLKFLE